MPPQDCAFDAFPSGRTRFGGIVAEFWGPKRPSRRAIILADGCPGMPQKERLGRFLARKGYWVFHFRYRGAWESRGSFLARSPHEDVLLVADAIRRPFRSVYGGTTFFLGIDDITVIGASFGGAAAILTSVDPRIRKAVAIAPVVDWKRVDREGESVAEFERMIAEGFPGAYRMKRGAARKLLSGKFYSPLSVERLLDPKKLFIIHDSTDTIVPLAPTRELVKRRRIPHLFPRGIGRANGHLSASIVMHRSIWPKIRNFLLLPQ